MSVNSESITTARRALVCLDLTNLDDGCDEEAIGTLCARAQTRHGFVAAVCVWPRFVAHAVSALDRTGIKVATVVNFPGGDGDEAEILAQTGAALADGADEIDLVVPYRRLMQGAPEYVASLTRAVKDVCGDAPLKTILETGVLADPVMITQAAEQALEGGADFLKTSTGKVPVNATPEAAEILLRTIARKGSPAGFKASGGVRDVEQAGVYLALADEIMGASWAGPDHFRFGASGLLNSLLATLAGTDAPDGDEDY